MEMPLTCTVVIMGLKPLKHEGAVSLSISEITPNEYSLTREVQPLPE
jgi:hypothetical protein